MTRRVDVLVSLPGPAEGLVPVIRALREAGPVRIFGLARDTLYPGIGGSDAILSKHFPDTVDLATALTDPGQLPGLLRADPPGLLLLGAVDDLENRRRYPEKDALRYAPELGFPTVQFVDNWSAFPVFAPGPDSLLVIDALSERLARRFCPGITDVFVSGHPGLQHLYQTEKSTSPGPPGRLGYFTQINLDTSQAITWLKQALRADEELWIKKHPRDTQDYGPLLRGFRCPVTLVQDPPEALYADIGHTVTHTSVVGLKAALLGLPVINLAPRELAPEVYDYLGGYPLAQAGLSREVNSAEELREALDESAPPEAQRLIEHFRLADATERMVKRLGELCGRGVHP